jgi:DNA processing protein
VVSQFPPGTPPLAGYFPARNRVIAGLSLGVVVVEAAEKSGSLITAGLAGELGREVMAVPGPLTSLMSRGAHRLIQDGAGLVQGWEDVVAQLPLRFRDQVKPLAVPAIAGSPDRLAHKDAENDESLCLLGVIGREPVGIDEIIERSGLAPGRASAFLMTLEIEGRIRQLEGKRFVAA